MIENNIISQEDFEKISLLDVWKCLNCETIKKASKGKVLREQPFILYLPACKVFDTTVTDKITLQGAIDMLSLGDENVLIDFKASKRSDDALKKTYSKQLELYSLAVENCMNVKVDKKIIFNLYNRHTIILN